MGHADEAPPEFVIEGNDVWIRRPGKKPMRLGPIEKVSDAMHMFLWRIRQRPMK